MGEFITRYTARLSLGSTRQKRIFQREAISLPAEEKGEKKRQLERGEMKGSSRDHLRAKEQTTGPHLACVQ